MTILNIRGTSGSGKSTLVRRFLDAYPHEPVMANLNEWKTDKVVAYKVYGAQKVDPLWHGDKIVEISLMSPTVTYVMGRYETQCGGWDAMSYKGSHEDLEEMCIQAGAKGNVIFEGLTISSSVTRWLRISQAFPGQMVWCFMDTPEEVCYERILARNGGREPKRDIKGLADYNRKFRNCVVQSGKLEAMGERVVWLSSDEQGYQKLLELLGE